ncbi:MAG: hypothetical protein U0441_27695 [Polyangiaceae bacterium]
MNDVSTAGASGKEGVPEAAKESEPARGLPFATRLVILALVVALFLFAHGPLWSHPWDAGALDSAIFWSYLPIPVLVAAGLLVAKRFSWLFLCLESMAIVLVKYAITFSLALVFWAVSGPPPAPAKTAAPPKTAAAPAEPPPPPPTPIAADQKGSVRGVVKDGAGQPVAGAFVFVASGLEAFVFERPTEPVRVENDGKSVHVSADGSRGEKLPAGLVVARAGQPIQGRSLDGHLHTLVATGDSTFNIPMISSGVWSTVVIREPAKVSRLRCTVHPEGETPGHLVVLDHPFYTATGADGSFRIEGIPGAKITLGAFHPSLGEGAAPIEIAPRAEASVDLRVAK